MQIQRTQAPDPQGAATSRTAAEELAAATGATIARTEDGFASVTFDAPAAPAQATIARDPTPSAAPAGSGMSIGGGRAAAPAGTSNAPVAPAAPPPQNSAPAPESAPTTDKDEIYDYVVDRLKRDLFAEQEQAGLGPTLL